jgi:hypothetical protein
MYEWHDGGTLRKRQQPTQNQHDQDDRQHPELLSNSKKLPEFGQE